MGMSAGGGGRGRRRLGGLNEINVTPLIDVMLVLLVIITADEHVYLGKDEITQALDDKLRTNARLQEEKELYVQADENVKYGAVLRVMAAARSAGVEKLGMITDPMVVK